MCERVRVGVSNFVTESVFERVRDCVRSIRHNPEREWECESVSESESESESGSASARECVCL